MTGPAIKLASRVWASIQNSPFAAPVVGIAFVALLMMPYFFWGVDKAAQFWGSFFAALTGLGGVIGAVMLNAEYERELADRNAELDRQHADRKAKLDREHAARSIRIAAIPAARMAVFELEHVLDSIDNIMKEKLSPPPAEDDQASLDHFDPEFFLFELFAEEDSLTVETDRHLALLCQQADAIATNLLGFGRSRNSFQQRVRSVKSTWELQEHSVKFGLRYLYNVLFVCQANATRAKTALEKFIADHADDFA